MLRVYLDTSVYNRPFDDQTQPRIYLETTALTTILQMVYGGKIDLVGSTVLDYENSRNPYQLRRTWVLRCLGLAKCYQAATDAVRTRARALQDKGLKAMDALHLACAESAGADYFLTCDDRVVKRGEVTGLRVMNPVVFVLQMAEGQSDSNSSP